MTARPVTVTGRDVSLEGDLAVPDDPAGLVVFAHGSGSSRHSPRNRQVAQVLQQSGLATLLLDLLTAEEQQVDLRTRELRFDVSLLADRLGDTIAWCRSHAQLERLPVGLFGTSTGGGAALLTAASYPDLVAAVVSRGGRPELAGQALAGVRAPVLLLVGELDVAVVDLNRAAAEKLHEHQLVFRARRTCSRSQALSSRSLRRLQRSSERIWHPRPDRVDDICRGAFRRRDESAGRRPGRSST